MITWKIEKRKLADLIGYDKNPRKFTYKGLKDLKASLERLGDANIITINADNTILGGHARVTLNKYEYEVIANYEHSTHKHWCVNTNALLAKPILPLTPKKYDCIYWGGYREDRANYFNKYFKNKMYVSTSAKNKDKFKKSGCLCKFVDMVDWTKSLTNLFRYNLYIEDNWIHTNFHNLANRWYEAGMCNLVTFFDIDCKNTVKKSEIADLFDDFYYVSSYQELMEKIEICNKDYNKHLEIQKAWHKRDLEVKEAVLKQIKDIIYG